MIKKGDDGDFTTDVYSFSSENLRTTTNLVAAAILSGWFGVLDYLCNNFPVITCSEKNTQG